MVDALENGHVHVEGILGIAEFFNAAILTSKVLVNGATCVVGCIKEVSDFANVSGAKRSETFFECLEHFESRCLMGIIFVRVDVGDESHRDRVKDVEDTGKVGVRVVREVGGSSVVLGLCDVNLGDIIGFRSLVYARWFDDGAGEDFSRLFSQFHLNFRVGINAMLAALGQKIFFRAHQDPFPVVVGVGNITSEASKVCYELLSNFEDCLPSRMKVNLIGFRFVLEGSSDFRDRGNRKDTHGGNCESRVRCRRLRGVWSAGRGPTLVGVSGSRIP